MSMNLTCQAVYSDGYTEQINLWQTPTRVSWSLVGGQGDFGTYEGLDMLLKYQSWVLTLLDMPVEDRVAHLIDLNAHLLKATGRGGRIEWFVI
jgi:hypothetical protein